MMQNVHFRRRRERTNPDPDNRPGGHSPAASPFSPVHLQTSSAGSSRDHRRSPSNTTDTEAAQGHRRLLSTAAQTIENQIEGLSSDGQGLSKMLPSRLTGTANQGQSESPFPEAWQKLEVRVAHMDYCTDAYA